MQALQRRFSGNTHLRGPEKDQTDKRGGEVAGICCTPFVTLTKNLHPWVQTVRLRLTYQDDR